MPSIIAIIPARAGSKRLPNKNRLSLAGTPLIGWTLRAANRAGCFQRVIVSTEDPEIAELARSHGGEVPWMRPQKLAGDGVRAAQVCAYVLEQLKREGCSPDAVMLLQPTSPFRSAETIRQAVELYQAHDRQSVISVSPATEHPHWCKRIDEQGILQPFITGVEAGRTQDLEPAFRVNGAIYLASVATVLDTGGFYSERTRALVMSDPVEPLDIDTHFDWVVAETFARQLATRKTGVTH